MRTAVFPGTFDPITLGHVDIARRALAVADRVIILVAHNSTKSPLLDAGTRVALAEAAIADIDGVSVDSTDGLLVDYCTKMGAHVIVKGLRGGADYDVERPMALMNRALTGVETAFLSGDPALQHIASSLVRDVARHGGDVAPMVPGGVVEALRAALGSTPGA